MIRHPALEQCGALDVSELDCFYFVFGTGEPDALLARALWIPAVLTWDEETGEVREGLHHVV